MGAFGGLLESGFLYVKFVEAKHQGMRLGRNLWLDGRSLPHMIENSVADMSGPVQSTQWERVLTILDQGDLGSCTGNAGAGSLGSEPFFSATGQGVLPDPTDAQAAEQFAIDLYAAATQVDAYAGTYPPDDTGSSGLAICKVLKDRGTISGYRFARSAYGFVRLLQQGPVLQGMPWYEAFFQPGTGGFIDADPRWRSSGLAGGHEVEALGIDLDTSDIFNSAITYANSWGTGWGDGGLFRMRLRTYEQLDHVDLKQYVV
jgi:hypothetical protein